MLALRAHRQEFIDQTITDHAGRIANTAGDSLLVEFISVVDAVRCSITFQEGMAARNSGIATDRQIRFRIGINIGDVIAQGSDILGGGVNIAARLEGLSEPGGILLFDDAYRQIRTRIKDDFVSGGPKRLKNIAEPVTVWRWSLEGANFDPAAASPSVSPALPALPPYDGPVTGDADASGGGEGPVTHQQLVDALADQTWQLMAAQLPDTSGDIIVARALAARLGNVDAAISEKRALRDKALDEGRDDDAVAIALELIEIADETISQAKTVLEQRHQAKFSDLVFLAALQGRKYDFTAIETYGSALQIEISLPDVDRQNALEARDRLIHALGHSKPTHDAAMAVFDAEYSPPYQWAIFASNILITKADTYAQARAHYDALPGLGLEPDIITLSSLITKADTYAQARAHYDALQGLGLEPDIFTLSSLITKADTYEQARAHYDALQ
ncbi:MAG: adenylate/guanylate cyclase domain-containing protein, partial [Paracoccaceae bacterium]